MDILYRWMMVYDEAGNLVDVNFTAAFIFLIVVYSVWLFVDRFFGVTEDTDAIESIFFAGIATVVTVSIFAVAVFAVNLLGWWTIILLAPILAAKLGELMRRRIG